MIDREPGPAVPRVYGLHGLRLRSPVALAGFVDGAHGHDVDVRWTTSAPVPGDAPPGRVIAGVTAGGSVRYVASAYEEGWTLRVPGVCDFLIDQELASVECRLDPAADPPFVAVLASGLLVGFLLTLAGHCVLHASAIEVDGRAVAFAGPSGAGKSTLAALSCAAGARLVSDDVLRVGFSSTTVCTAGSSHLRLRPGATWALDHFASPPATHSTPDARIGVAPATVDRPLVPLSAIVLPRLSRAATATHVQRRTGAAAVAMLAAAPRVGGWTDPDVVRAQFAALAGVARDVPVVEAVIPWREASNESAVAVVVEVLRAVGCELAKSPA